MKRGFTLGTTYVANSNKKLDLGFTLAEVLITLGIIGVVAAITMPTLIQNYQKQVLVNQFKKTYVTLFEGMKRLVADEGCTNLECTSLCTAYSSSWIYQGNRRYECILKISDEDIRNKIINIFQLSNVKYESGEFPLSGFLPDGAHIDITVGSDGPQFHIDTNGLKGPNKDGRDYFILHYGDKNNAVIVEPYESFPTSGCPEPWAAFSCPSKIIEDGWKMNY